MFCHPIPHRNFWTCRGTLLCLWHVILSSGPGEGLDWHWFVHCLHCNSLSCVEILVAWDDPSLDVRQIWSFQEGKFFPWTRSLVWNCFVHVAAWVLTLWWPSVQEDSVPQRSSSPKSNHLSYTSWPRSYAKISSRLFCLFCAALSGIRLVRWRDSFGFVFVGKVDGEEHPVMDWDLRGFATWTSYVPTLQTWLWQITQGTNLKRKAVNLSCLSSLMWEKRSCSVAGTALPDAVWISVRLVPIPEFTLCGGISLHLCVYFV